MILLSILIWFLFGFIALFIIAKLEKYNSSPCKRITESGEVLYLVSMGLLSFILVIYETLVNTGFIINLYNKLKK